MQPVGRVHQYLKENDLGLICTKAGPISHFCGKTEVDGKILYISQRLSAHCFPSVARRVVSPTQSAKIQITIKANDGGTEYS